MSKKAKKLKKSKRATALDAAKAEAHNANTLVEQYGAEITSLKADLASRTKQWEEARDNSHRASENNMLLRQSINDLKVLVSDRERDCAESRGTIRALNRQIDQGAPKVMVTPPRMVSPMEAHEFFIHGGRIGARGEVDVTALERAVSSKRHWTAI